jgi:two-component system response regulator YesN
MCQTLLVEDYKRYREVLKRELNEWFPSMMIEEAENGREAVEKVGLHCPTLIFVDISLPDESGLDLTQKVKGKCPGTTIVMLMSYDDPEYRQAAMQRGASHYFVKGTSSLNDIKVWVESFLHTREKTMDTGQEQFDRLAKDGCRDTLLPVPNPNSP